jgi:hypothetical protein
VKSLVTLTGTSRQFKLQPEDAAVGSIVGFGPEPGTLYVIALNGSFYRVTFDITKGGPCIQEAYFKFLSNQKDLV